MHTGGDYKGCGHRSLKVCWNNSVRDISDGTRRGKEFPGRGSIIKKAFPQYLPTGLLRTDRRAEGAGMEGVLHISWS